MYLNLTINCIFIQYVIIIVLSKSNGFKVGRTCKRGTTSTHVPSSMAQKKGGEGGEKDLCAQTLRFPKICKRAEYLESLGNKKRTL